MLTVFIIFIVIAALVFAGDVHSTYLNNENPNIEEINGRYKLPNGHCNVPKLVRDKAIVFGAFVVPSIVLFIFGAGYFAVAAPAVLCFVTAPTVINNYALYRKYNKK